MKAAAALVICLVPAVPSLHAATAALKLEIRESKRAFRMGEEIEATLLFRASAAGAFLLRSLGVDRRYVRDAEFDWFVSGGESGAVDPLADSGTLFSGVLPGNVNVAPLGAEAIGIPAIVNDWISFRKPGTYSIVARSKRIWPQQGFAPVFVESRPVRIVIRAASPEWTRRQLRTALGLLARPEDRALPNPQAQMRGTGIAKGARMLRFLETRDAVPHLVRLFENGPQAAQQDIRAGLLASPHRGAVIEEMERAIRDPQFPVTYYWLGTLMQIVYSHRYGARDASAAGEKIYQERFGPIARHYRQLLEAALPHKQGRAHQVASETLAHTARDR